MSKKNEEPAEGKEPEGSWKDVIYNPRTGEFFGRTANNWGLILLFYLVFYGFLVAMFVFTMWVMLQTLNDDTPKYRDRVASPGLAIRPNSLNIVFNRSEPLQYDQYVQHLELFLHRYNDSEQAKNDLCMAGQYSEQDEEPQKKVCQFRRSLLQHCSGMEDTTYGYAKGQPCVIVKMNRGDKPLQMQYFPHEGTIDRMYFPYYGKKTHEGYVQPLVAVKLLLKKEDYNSELIVECKVEGSNLKNNDERDKFLGRVTFQVLVTE
ncbi:sodium/potassium-transporting ATPase subunit beta-3 isoform X2 [Carassius gibelio]|uniref:sodium/potassium-transporting ATPase subunit beta-3 isoform X2 n=1 Tax=Carassius gibelio TaxID=101364 RepID=UPI002279CE10|nr:sodium/potassium-transporting ATPase subunit beta-3 isoform X2 [Carassius gibelio]